MASPLERHLGQIADVTEMSSISSVGTTNVSPFSSASDRDIDGAARDVQAAINGAAFDLPTLPSRPTYTKQNPSNAPIMVLNLTSDTLSRAQIYDVASLILQQKLSQIEGVGQADLQGGSAPAVRVELNPRSLNKYGIGVEDVRAAISGTNANQPKGLYSENGRRHQLYANDQALKAADYAPLIVAVRNGSPVRLSDVASVSDGAQSDRNLGIYNGKNAITVRIQAAPNANIVATVDRIKAVLPSLQAALPKAVVLDVSLDRTTDIRGSLVDVERTLLISVVLVVLVVLLFLRNGRATLIPAVAVVTSLLGTLGVMWLMHFSLDNLSLMSLTVATGFVVDDAIVVLENISRHVEEGMPRFQAAMKGSAEVGFTVVSMSISLIAVFLPILLMGGVVGRLFREFAVTLSAAILISLVVSLTTTPMMSARLVDERPSPEEEERIAKAGGLRGFMAKVGRGMERGFAWVTETYDGSLTWALDHGRIVLLTLLATVVFNVYLYAAVPKGFLPSQGHRGDAGLHPGGPGELVRRHPRQVQEAGRHRPARSGGGQGDILRVRLGRLHVRGAETEGPAGRPQHRPGHRAPAAEDLRRLRRAAVPERRAGLPRRRPPDQRHLPVRPAERRPGPAEDLVAEADRRPEAPPRAHRRQQRPAGARPGDLHHHRP